MKDALDLLFEMDEAARRAYQAGKKEHEEANEARREEARKVYREAISLLRALKDAPPGQSAEAKNTTKTIDRLFELTDELYKFIT